MSVFDGPLLALLKEHPQALRVIPVIFEKKAVNMREFTFYGQMTEKTAREVREGLRQKWGLIVVLDPDEKTTNDMEIRLTKEGEEVARALLSAEPALETGRRKARADRA